MRLKELCNLIDVTIESMETHPNIGMRQGIIRQLHRANNSLRNGNLQLPWSLKAGSKIEHQSITALTESGTPIDEETGDDLELDLTDLH